MKEETSFKINWYISSQITWLLHLNLFRDSSIWGPESYWKTNLISLLGIVLKGQRHFPNLTDLLCGVKWTLRLDWKVSVTVRLLNVSSSSLPCPEAVAIQAASLPAWAKCMQSYRYDKFCICSHRGHLKKKIQNNEQSLRCLYMFQIGHKHLI